MDDLVFPLKIRYFIASLGSGFRNGVKWMTYRYIVKVYFEDGEIIENSGDDLEYLTEWLSDQVESSFGEIKGEIYDNHTNHLVKTIEYSPPDS